MDTGARTPPRPPLAPLAAAAAPSSPSRVGDATTSRTYTAEAGGRDDDALILGCGAGWCWCCD